MFSKKGIKDIEITNKRIFLRVDFNVPLNNQSVECTHKIEASLPTIKYILKNNPSKLIIGTHLGRPKGEEMQYSVKPIILLLNSLLKESFILKSINEPMEERLIFLENLRFFKEEKEGYGDFFKRNCDYAVIDAFGVSHRSDKSLFTGLPTVMGLLMEEELKRAQEIIDGIDLAVFGGAKISDKIKLISDIPSKEVWLVGAIANTVLKLGFNKETGQSKTEENIDLSEIKKLKIKLPCDFVTKNLSEIKNTKEIGKNESAVDIGKISQSEIKKDILKSKSVFWNGPAGIFENKEFEEGTKVIAEALIQLTKEGGRTYVGGGETAMAALKYGNMKDYSFVSTGGGALMTLLSGGDMPGIHAIDDK